MSNNNGGYWKILKTYPPTGNVVKPRWVYEQSILVSFFALLLVLVIFVFASVFLHKTSPIFFPVVFYPLLDKEIKHINKQTKLFCSPKGALRRWGFSVWFWFFLLSIVSALTGWALEEGNWESSCELLQHPDLQSMWPNSIIPHLETRHPGARDSHAKGANAKVVLKLTQLPCSRLPSFTRYSPFGGLRTAQCQSSQHTDSQL